MSPAREYGGEWGHLARRIDEMAAEIERLKENQFNSEDVAASLAGFSAVLLSVVSPDDQGRVLVELKAGLRRVGDRMNGTVAADALRVTADMLDEAGEEPPGD